jgi:hypothetical protein
VSYDYFDDYRNAANALDEISNLHSPIVPPEGMALMGSKKGQQYCAECTPDDPFYAVEWPCPTRLIVDEAFK